MVFVSRKASLSPVSLLVFASQRTFLSPVSLLVLYSPRGFHHRFTVGFVLPAGPPPPVSLLVLYSRQVSHHPFHCWSLPPRGASQDLGQVYPGWYIVSLYTRVYMPPCTPFVGGPPSGQHCRPHCVAGTSSVYVCGKCTFSLGSSGGWDGLKKGVKSVKTALSAQTGGLHGAIPYGIERLEQKGPEWLLKVLSRLLTAQRPKPVIPCFIGVLAGFRKVYSRSYARNGVIPSEKCPTLGL